MRLRCSIQPFFIADVVDFSHFGAHRLARLATTLGAGLVTLPTIPAANYPSLAVTITNFGSLRSIYSEFLAHPCHDFEMHIHTLECRPTHASRGS